AIPRLMLRLLTHSDQLRAVVADRKLVPGSIEESLRLDVPVVYISRLATRDAEIAGVPVPKGAFVTLCLASANRDESRWAEPDRFEYTARSSSTSRSRPARTCAWASTWRGWRSRSPCTPCWTACPGSG